MYGICLINQVRSRKLPYTSQIAEEASFFPVTLFRAWFCDNRFSKIKFNLLKMLEASQKHNLTMLVKLLAFIPQFNQFHPGCYCHIASLDDYFWIYVYCHTGETTYLSCIIFTHVTISGTNIKVNRVKQPI